MFPIVYCNHWTVVIYTNHSNLKKRLNKLIKKGTHIINTLAIENKTLFSDVNNKNAPLLLYLDSMSYDNTKVKNLIKRFILYNFLINERNLSKEEFYTHISDTYTYECVSKEIKVEYPLVRLTITFNTRYPSKKTPLTAGYTPYPILSFFSTTQKNLLRIR